MNIKSMTLPEVTQVLKDMGQSAFRGKQVFFDVKRDPELTEVEPLAIFADHQPALAEPLSHSSTPVTYSSAPTRSSNCGGSSPPVTAFCTTSAPPKPR